MNLPFAIPDHRYVGLGPTLAWLQVCRDPFYPVLYDSSEAFARL
jgi:hypothetical protein